MLTGRPLCPGRAAVLRGPAVVAVPALRAKPRPVARVVTRRARAVESADRYAATITWPYAQG
jgi:hypothetical protein